MFLALMSIIAFRLGELRNNRLSSAPWFQSNQYQGILRADYKIISTWEVLAEYRARFLDVSDEMLHGPLVAVYRQLWKDPSWGVAKIGLGYNFTDYSTSLIDQSYSNHGFFINMVAGF